MARQKKKQSQHPLAERIESLSVQCSGPLPEHPGSTVGEEIPAEVAAEYFRQLQATIATTGEPSHEAMKLLAKVGMCLALTNRQAEADRRTPKRRYVDRDCALLAAFDCHKARGFSDDQAIREAYKEVVANPQHNIGASGKFTKGAAREVFRRAGKLQPRRSERPSHKSFCD